MPVSLPFLSLGSTALSIILISAQTLASESKNEKPEEETTVIGQYLYANQVNSVKTPTPILNVPQSLSIISADQILEQGFNSVGDIINYTPGVNNSQGEGHRDAIVFRGVRSTADFFIDGVRDDVQYYRPLYNLEQVEVLRGPNALLFGRGGTGGILNRVTKKAEIDEDFTGYQVGVDSFGAYNLQIDTNVAINDGAAFRLNAFYEELDNHRDFFDGERLGFNPTAKFVFGSDTTLDLSYEYIDFQRFVDRGIPTDANGSPVEALDEIIFGDPEINDSELQANIFRANLQHVFSEELKLNVSAFFGDFDKLYSNFFAVGYDESTNIVTLDGYIDGTDRQNLILSSHLVGEFATGDINHTFIVGTEYIDTASDQDRHNSFFDTAETETDREDFFATRPINFRGGVGVNARGETTTNSFDVDLNDDTRVDIEVTSLFFQDEIELSKYLDLVLGARFDEFDIEVLNVPADDFRTRVDREISPRAGLIFKPEENVSLYLSYSETFLPRSGEQFANINGDNDELEPDVFESQEIGVKWDFTQGLSLTAAYFQNDQTRADRDNDTGEEFEIRGIEIEGFEVQVQGHFTEDWSIQAGYSFLEGETGDGEQPRELPENMFSAWSNLQATEKLGFGLGVVYQDESLITDGGIATLPSYTRIDTAVFYDFSEQFRLQLNIENLTDETYFPDAHSTHQATVGAPINARLTLSGKF